MELKFKFYYLSIILSLIGIYLCVSVHYKLGLNYHLADGKTQALYGLKKIILLAYIYFGALGSLILIGSLIRKENRLAIIISFLLSLFALSLPFIDLWKLWI